MKRGDYSLFWVTIFAVLALVSSATANGQTIPKSQAATVTQQVGNTKIEIIYQRPVARGRELFGKLVPYGKVWSPSANAAARFTFSTGVTVNGSELAAGTYTFWAIPDAEAWTLIFNGTPSAFHMSYPEGKDVLRVKAALLHGDHVESLQFSFPMIDADSTYLHLRWGTTIVPLTIRASAP